MELIETRIQRIYRFGNYVLYGFMIDCKKGYSYSVVNYSKESDFMSNAFGANDKLKFKKTAYITVKDRNIVSISNEYGETIIPELYYCYGGVMKTHNTEYINNELGMSTNEYINLVSKEIKGKALVK